MIFRSVLATLILLIVYPYLCAAHGRMMDPPARNSMWRLGFNNPVNYNDNELYCGGRMVQWIRNKGKCGICGDPYHGNRPHEAGGKFAKGVIGKSYHEGEVIPVVVHLTANHQGWFEFKICPVNDPKKKVTQECLDKHVLQRADGKGTTFPIPQGKYNAFFNFSVKLPEGLTCKQCVIQWKYRTGNTWDKDDRSGVFCLGCGPQEEFYNCADVEILPKGEKSKWKKETVPTTTTNNGLATSAPTAKPTTTPPITTPYQKKKTTSKYKPTTKPTTPKPKTLNRHKQKLQNMKKESTSAETYLVAPNSFNSERREWLVSSTKKKASTLKKSKRRPLPIKVNSKEHSTSPFKKPQKKTLPTWLVNSRRIQERKRKLMERRQKYLQRQELIRKQKAYRRHQELKRIRAEKSKTTRRMIQTTASKTSPVLISTTPYQLPLTTRRPTTVTKLSTTRRPLSTRRRPPFSRVVPTPRPTKRFMAKSSYTPCDKNHAHEKNSMVASTDIPDAPIAAVRTSKSRNLTPSPIQRNTVYVTRRPSFSQHDYVPHVRKSKPLHPPAHYEVEYPEHPVVETEQALAPPVHRHNIPFQSRSPFANPGSSHTNPIINYWWNQYQRPVVNLWNNVRPVLKCHATIALGGGMDEWCTANCNANFCPGGMCVCSPQSSVYPTYSVYPQESQSWMNSFTPSVHIDTPRPINVQNPYLIHRRHQQQLQVYKNQAIRQQQQHMTNIYTGHNSIQRNAIDEASAEKLVKKYAPTIASTVPIGTEQVLHKRSTYEPLTTTKSNTNPKATSKITLNKTPLTTASSSKTTRHPSTSKAMRFFWPLLKSFKASITSDRTPKRTSTTWLFNTLRTSKSAPKVSPTKETFLPERGYKASPSSETDVTKVQNRTQRLKSKSLFLKPNRDIKCRAVGRYKGLKRFDNWCNRNCMLTICPLLICHCEH